MGSLYGGCGLCVIRRIQRDLLSCQDRWQTLVNTSENYIIGEY